MATRTSFDPIYILFKAIKIPDTVSLATSVNLTVLLFISTFLLNIFSATDHSSTLTNGFSLFFMFILPLSVLGVCVFAPDLVTVIDQQLALNTARVFPGTSIKEDNKARRMRICYHEAGHFLAAYLCGIPVLGYVISSSQGRVFFGPSFPINPPTTSNTELLENMYGRLLVNSMTGIAAEIVMYGTSKLGEQDVQEALQELHQYAQITHNNRTLTSIEVENYLRWALLKAVSLLRLHHVALEEVAHAMLRQASVIECMALIEASPLIDADIES
jgi:hypothetical protein